MMHEARTDFCMLLGGLFLLIVGAGPWSVDAGARPFWHQLRSQGWTQAALSGANAAVVGLLSAALYSPVWTGGVKTAPDAATAVAGFALLQWWKLPPWLVVVLPTPPYNSCCERALGRGGGPP